MAIGLRGAVQGRQGSKLNQNHPATKRMMTLVNSLNVGDMEEQAVNEAFKEGESIWTDVVNENVSQESLPARASIGEAQVNYPPEMVETLFPNEAAAYGLETPPALPPEVEDEMALDFARLKGVTLLDMLNNPALREEYARYLGQRTRTMDNDRYYLYDDQGYSADKEGVKYSEERAPTLYRTPTRLEQLARETYPDYTSAPKLAEAARGVEENVKYRLQQYGATEEEANRIWEENQNFNTEENIIAVALGSLANTATTLAHQDDHPRFVDGLEQMAEKVFYSLRQTFLGNEPRMNPQAMERFVDRIIENNPDISRIGAKEFLFKYMANYGSIAEMNPNAARAYSDFMLLSVMDYAKRKLVRYEQNKEDDDAGELTAEQRAETTEQAVARNEQKLMMNVADDRAIGEVILTNMRWEGASSEDQAIAGALAKAIVGDAFKFEDAAKADPDFKYMADEKLFEVTTSPKQLPDGTYATHPTTGRVLEYTGVTLTERGLEIANRLEPLFASVMKNSRRTVRYNRTNRNNAVIRKLKNKQTAEGKDVDIGDTNEMDEMLTVARNTPVTINPLMAEFIKVIAAELKKFSTMFGRRLDSQEAVTAYQQTLMSLLDGPAFQNMKGDGDGDVGIYGFRPGKVYSRNRQGEIALDEAGERVSFQDFSDGIKDNSFNDAVQFIEDNAGVEFFYDYFFGLNTRLNVSQTIGNYQGSKLIRSTISSFEPHAYKLNDPIEVISLKAGIMKRFGYDKMDLLTAADMFDAQVAEWSQADAKRMIEIAAKWEGWGSIASMLEAVAFNTELQNPNSKGVYTTGFYTEIDGLTNGMAHSSAQAGDLKTGWAANLFDPKTHSHWAKNYDELERLVREGEFDGLDPEQRAELAIYLDAYNQVNDRMKNMMRRLWGKGDLKPVDIYDVGLPGLIETSASEAAKTIMNRAHGASGDGKGFGSVKFKDALKILRDFDSPLGRKFIKKPVMIFGYGAGAARIGEAVRNFVDELFMTKEGIEMRQAMVDNGIDIDKHFIDPLGIIAAEAVNQQFAAIKDFASTLSATATEAASQGFALRIPTLAGYFINLGGIEYEVDKAKGRTVQFQYFPGRAAAAKNRMKGKGGKKGMARTTSGVMKATFNPFFGPQGFLKAATQITVMLNHANDNINMNRHLVNVHKRKLADKGITSYEAWLAQLENPNNAIGKRNGNTALHIFDGLLVQPFEAEMHANELNKVFLQMMKAQKGHTSFVEDALTFELSNSGERIAERIPRRLGKKKWSQYSKVQQSDMIWKRLLTDEGMALHKSRNPAVSTWHPDFDEFAFDWDNPVAGEIRNSLRHFDTERQKMANTVKHVHQFFWGTRPLSQQIASADKKRISKHVQPKRKIAA